MGWVWLDGIFLKNYFILKPEALEQTKSDFTNQLILLFWVGFFQFINGNGSR